MKNITILGGCLARDFFAIGGNDDPKYHINKFIQCQNIMSLNCPQLSEVIDEKINIEGKLKHPIFSYWAMTNAEKDVFKELDKYKGDYLVFGLTDVYHGIVKITNDTGKMTFMDNSVLFQYIFYDYLQDERFKGIEIEKINFIEYVSTDEGKKHLDDALDFIEENLLKKYNNSKIIFLQTLGATKYIDKNGMLVDFNRNPLVNKWLSYCNEHFIKNVNPKVIKLPENIIADINHKWGGPNPFHWIDAVYRYMFRAFEICVNDYYVNKELELSILYNDFERFLQGFWTRDEYLVSRYDDSIIDRNLTISNVIINFLGDNTKKFEILNISDKNAITEMPDYIEENGYSNIIKSSIGNIDISMKALEDGKMVIKLSGVEVKNEQGNFIPYWIDYKKWSINNHVILDSIHAAWYKRPIFINLEVKKNTVIDMHIEWAMHIDDRQ